MTCVTPSPLSITVPVSVRSPGLRLIHDAASASTACTAMYSPGTLNVSNMISAVYSRFSGVLSGGSVSSTTCSLGSHCRYLKKVRCQKRSMLSQFSTMPWRIG